MSDKKQWKMVIVAAVVFFMIISNKVEASEERARTIPILETVWVEEDLPQGNRMGLPQTSVGGGKTVSFLDSSGSMFYVSGGTTVSFSVNLNASASDMQRSQDKLVCCESLIKCTLQQNQS